MKIILTSVGLAIVLVCFLSGLAEVINQHVARKLRKPILDLLSDGKERYTIEIAEQLQTAIQYVSVTLQYMEIEGFLSSRNGEPLPERGGRPRRYYKLIQKEPS